MGQTSLFRLMLLGCGKGVQLRCFAEQRIALPKTRFFEQKRSNWSGFLIDIGRAGELPAVLRFCEPCSENGRRMKAEE